MAGSFADALFEAGLIDSKPEDTVEESKYMKASIHDNIHMFDEASKDNIMFARVTLLATVDDFDSTKYGETIREWSGLVASRGTETLNVEDDFGPGTHKEDYVHFIAMEDGEQFNTLKYKNPLSLGKTTLCSTDEFVIDEMLESTPELMDKYNDLQSSVEWTIKSSQYGYLGEDYSKLLSMYDNLDSLCESEDLQRMVYRGNYDGYVTAMRDISKDSMFVDNIIGGALAQRKDGSQSLTVGELDSYVRRRRNDIGYAMYEQQSSLKPFDEHVYAFSGSDDHDDMVKWMLETHPADALFMSYSCSNGSFGFGSTPASNPYGVSASPEQRFVALEEMAARYGASLGSNMDKPFTVDDLRFDTPVKEESKQVVATQVESVSVVHRGEDVDFGMNDTTSNGFSLETPGE